MGGTENAATAAETASNASQAAQAAGTAADVGTMAGSNAAGSGVLQSAGNGVDPSVMNSGYFINESAPANYVEGGVNSSPSFMDSAVEYMDRMNKGSGQSLGQAWQNKGWNPETYGYVLGKMGGLMKGGGSGNNSAPPMVTNVSYQQPENSYLAQYQKRRLY